jgi:hypothetical protein
MNTETPNKENAMKAKKSYAEYVVTITDARTGQTVAESRRPVEAKHLAAEGRDVGRDAWLTLLGRGDADPSKRAPSGRPADPRQDWLDSFDA